jgi:hypothetical protein
MKNENEKEMAGWMRGVATSIECKSVLTSSFLPRLLMSHRVNVLSEQRHHILSCKLNHLERRKRDGCGELILVVDMGGLVWRRPVAVQANGAEDSDDIKSSPTCHCTYRA